MCIGRLENKNARYRQQHPQNKRPDVHMPVVLF